MSVLLHGYGFSFSCKAAFVSIGLFISHLTCQLFIKLHIFKKISKYFRLYLVIRHGLAVRLTSCSGVSITSLSVSNSLPAADQPPLTFSPPFDPVNHSSLRARRHATPGELGSTRGHQVRVATRATAVSDLFATTAADHVFLTLSHLR